MRGEGDQLTDATTLRLLGRIAAIAYAGLFRSGRASISEPPAVAGT